MDISSIKGDGGNAQNMNMTESYYSAFQHSPKNHGNFAGVKVWPALFHCSLLFEHVIIYRISKLYPRARYIHNVLYILLNIQWELSGKATDSHSVCFNTSLDGVFVGIFALSTRPSITPVLKKSLLDADPIINSVPLYTWVGIKTILHIKSFMYALSDYYCTNCSQDVRV